ncbi:MAG: orotidine-5'-phosphate decarboxylase [Planctomycetota bacterium]|jgi:orotidine-5'-phosphate decarboxylase
MVERFSSRLASEVSRKGAAVVGLDPRLEALPADLVPDAAPEERILAFYRETMPLIAQQAALVKPNIAFFERFGAAGYAAYVETCSLAREAGLLVIGDIKRGDIGSTAEAYAEEHFRHADALTLHPYLGSDSLRPFMERCSQGDRGVFILVRTSNPSASEFQDLAVEGGNLSQAVARRVALWATEAAPAEGEYSSVGAVMGATYAADLGPYRELMPRSWFLIPGVGAQGGQVSDLAEAFDEKGHGALVNQSRGIMQAFEPGDEDWRGKIAAALSRFVSELSSLCKQVP